MGKIYEMKEDGFYGVVRVPKQIFENLDEKYFISHSSNTVKYMCANRPEEIHLNSFGINTSVVCDWFKIILEKDDEKNQ